MNIPHDPNPEIVITRPDGAVGSMKLGDATDDTGNSPLVSCLMPTRGDPAILRYALECYLNQDYQNRELIVVATDPSSELEALLARSPQANIRLVRVPASLTLGERRNASIAHAWGAWTCTWDDDDLYDPSRISMQLRAARVSRTAAVFLSRMMVWWPAEKTMVVSKESAWEGTMLARRDVIPVYPALERHEDNWVVKAIRRFHPVSFLPTPALYCCTHTGKNTSGVEHVQKMVREAEMTYQGQAYEDMLTSLAARLPIRQYQSVLVALLLYFAAAPGFFQ